MVIKETICLTYIDTRINSENTQKMIICKERKAKRKSISEREGITYLLDFFNRGRYVADVITRLWPKYANHHISSQLI